MNPTVPVEEEWGIHYVTIHYALKYSIKQSSDEWRWKGIKRYGFFPVYSKANYYE